MSDGGRLGIPFDNSLASLILLSQTIEQRWIGDQSRDEHRQNVTIPVQPGLDQGARSAGGCLSSLGVQPRNHAVDQGLDQLFFA